MRSSTHSRRVLFFGLALTLTGCSEGCHRVNPQGHSELPPVSTTLPKPTADLLRLTVPATVDNSAARQTLAATVKRQQPFVLRWEPPDERRGKGGTLPKVMFKIVKVRADKSTVTMTSKGFSGGKEAEKEYDACEVKVDAPPKAGEYHVRVITIAGDILSESLLRVE